MGLATVCSMIFMLARMCIRIGRSKLENSYIMFNLRKESALSMKFMCWNNTFTKGARFIEEFLCVCQNVNHSTEGTKHFRVEYARRFIAQFDPLQCVHKI